MEKVEKSLEMLLNKWNNEEDSSKEKMHVTKKS